MALPRFRTLARGGDLRIAVWGDDAEELLANAVLAVTRAALGTAPRGRPAARAAIRPWPADLTSQLVRAANEAIFTLLDRGSLPVGLEVRAGGASLLLAPLPDGLTPALEIKAATYHGLWPRRRNGRLGATITFDL
jgi:SHS2 domain-containing protein